MGKALRLYRMIQEGDRVLVCVSGGVDSWALLQLLLERQRHVHPRFELTAAHIDLGFNREGSVLVEKMFQDLEVEYRIVPTRIASLAFAPDASKNPCFICAHHRRHAVYKLAHAEGCNKIAYGHHKDDIVETLLINILYGRKIEAIRPVQEVFKGKMHLIRPLALLEEDVIKKYAALTGLEPVPKVCPVDGTSRREKVKRIIRELQMTEKNANIRSNIFRALEQWDEGFAPPVN